MKALRPFSFGLARLLSRHPPATGFSWPCRIADVQDHQDVRVEPRRASRQIGVLAARIRVAVRPRRPRLPVRELPRVDRIADVPNQNAFVVWLVRVGAPSKRRLLQRRYHDVIVERHLDGPGVTGTRDGFHEFRILRIGNVHDAPAVMPQMPHVEVPMAIDLLNGHLEGALAVVESAISDGLHVVGFPSRWDGIGVAARRQPRGSDRNGAACGSASEIFHGAHPRLVIAKTSAHGLPSQYRGRTHADFYDVAQLDRPRNPRSQGFAEALRSRARACNAANATNATLYEKLNFNFIRDIAPVAGIIVVPMVMVVNPSVPAKTVPDFIAYATANPGKINLASGSIGGPSHVAGEPFTITYGTDMLLVPYRGMAPAVTDLLGGQVQVLFNSLPASIGYIKADRLRALAVTTATRAELLPDIPTISEFFPGYEASQWYGLGVPKNTPAEIVDKLNKEVNAALADPKMKARLADLGGVVLPGSPAEFGKLIAEETEKWAKVVKFAGIKAD